MQTMNQLGNFSDGEFEAAIAAAAYAITSLEARDGLKKQRGSVKFSGDSLLRTKTRDEATKVKLTSFRGSFKRWFSDQEPREDAKPKDQDAKPGGRNRIDSAKETRPALPRVPSTKKPPTSFGNRGQAAYSPERRKAEAEADAWEKAQMIKIKNRYDKTMATIIEWENEKKAKAKSRMERKQNKTEKSRARALQIYGEEISKIEKVAGKARALAEEKKRNDETKTRVKAEKIRSTGKMPQMCYCC